MLVLALLSARASAGTVQVPSDIAITLTAAPTAALRPGQPVEFTLGVTNNGPAPVRRLLITGPDVYDQIYLPGGAWTDCPMFLTVVDGSAASYWYLFWYPAFPNAPDIAVGETRTCRFRLELTPAAQAVTPVSVGLPSFYLDPNPSNDRATVLLTRAVTPAATPVPTLARSVLVLLAGLLAGIAALRLFRLTGNRF
nr:hypothetical protein [Tahibacter harae]